MSTIIGILTIMSRINFLLSWFENEKSFISPRSGLLIINVLLSITALASPVPPQFMTPGMKQIEKQADLMFPDPAAKLPFDKNPCDSPQVPTFQTPGLSISKQVQVAMVAPRQAPGEKKAVVGLFKEEAGSGFRRGPLDSQARVVKEEPVEPDLTYSLEVCTHELRHEKTYFRGFRPCPTQTRLYSNKT